MESSDLEGEIKRSLQIRETNGMSAGCCSEISDGARAVRGNSRSREGSIFKISSQGESKERDHPIKRVGSPPRKGIRGARVKESISGPQVCHLLISVCTRPLHPGCIRPQELGA